MIMVIYLTLIALAGLFYILLKKVIAYENEFCNNVHNACIKEGILYTRILNGKKGELLIYNESELVAKYVVDNKMRNEQKFHFEKLA